MVEIKKHPDLDLNPIFAGILSPSRYLNDPSTVKSPLEPKM